MKFIHISDLHFGKSIHGVSLEADQYHWIEEFVKLAAEEKPDAILIAGDVYDRSAPTNEAVVMFDKFLTD